MLTHFLPELLCVCSLLCQNKEQITKHNTVASKTCLTAVQMTPVRSSSEVTDFRFSRMLRKCTNVSALM